ncbi:hypothetical protein NQZ68_004536 [Dissostichus eleginoides]|nr:hypothetical protein NQZ68_004536 [Dissostichus eleginoides]
MMTNAPQPIDWPGRVKDKKPDTRPGPIAKDIEDIVPIPAAPFKGLKCWLQWSAAIGVVSVENYLCSIILMAVSNCIIPEQQVALAAGVIALTASPHWPRGSGQALTTAPANLLLCSIADQGPESSVMPSGSALSVGRRGDLHRMDDMVAESKSASPREVGTLLINLSQETSALHKPDMWLPKALAEPPVISLLGKMRNRRQGKPFSIPLRVTPEMWRG